MYRCQLDNNGKLLPDHTSLYHAHFDDHTQILIFTEEVIKIMTVTVTTVISWDFKKVNQKLHSSSKNGEVHSLNIVCLPALPVITSEMFLGGSFSIWTHSIFNGNTVNIVIQNIAEVKFPPPPPLQAENPL